MATFGWEVERLDVDAYHDRIGLTVQPPSRVGLDRLLEAHVRTFTFDNIDVLLEQHPGVGLDAIQSKFVVRGRGGYCFEHATLFAAALERLGYVVERRLGRVGDKHTMARTHAVVVVTIEGEQLLCDPGFRFSTMRAIPLVDGAEDDYAGRVLRVREVPEGAGRAWELHRRTQDDWELAHTHDELPVRPVDLVHGHHYTSTFPTSIFRRTLMVAGHDGDDHLSITESTETVRRLRAPTEHRQITLADLPSLLHRLNVPLSDEELQRLLSRLSDL
ncbi:MAG: arylamine N-acetyltransferase [Ilumatobacteraceae bacterium]